jgi:hypothetical protein
LVVTWTPRCALMIQCISMVLQCKRSSAAAFICPCINYRFLQLFNQIAPRSVELCCSVRLHFLVAQTTATCSVLLQAHAVCLPVMDCFICCVFCVLYCFVTLYYSVLMLFFLVFYCSFFLYCTVSACDVRAATLTEVFPCFFLSCNANARV